MVWLRLPGRSSSGLPLRRVPSALPTNGRPLSYGRKKAASRFIGRLCGNDALATGEFIASVVSEEVSRRWSVPLLFLIAGAIAFSTGTSWGTFAIMLAIAVPLGERLGIRQELLVAAVLGGGVFGDHCSPISDTTVVSSMAAATDHIDHVRTQLPYALAAGFGALLLYAAVSL